MRPLKIYADTSLIGGYFDDEFSDDTKVLFEKILKQYFQLVISDLTERELKNAPEKVRKLLLKKSIPHEFVFVNEECINLANEYLNEKVVGKTSLEDCIHIATATVHKLDILVSWNFKHIVNIQRIRGYNSVNIKNGYSTIEIRSPKELINYED